MRFTICRPGYLLYTGKDVFDRSENKGHGWISAPNQSKDSGPAKHARAPVADPKIELDPVFAPPKPAFAFTASLPHVIFPKMTHKLKVPAPRDATFLRIQVSDAGVSQMQYAPGTSTDPGYGFIFLFQQGTLANADDIRLEQGTLVVRVQPSAVSQFDLAILSRLLQPFNGYFEMDVMGTYTAQQVSATQNVIELLVDSISTTNIQPS